MINSILPADTFIVLNSTILNDNDRKLLIMLYQPIIGSDAISLYFTLWTYLDKTEIISKEWTHHHLISSMHMSLNDLLNARIKLEAIGLLKTYQKKEHQVEYLYELYSPLSAKEFFESPLLYSALENNIGKIEFQNVIEYFKIPKIDKSSYVDVSQKFKDVFKIKPSNYYDNILNDIKEKKHNELEIEFDIKAIIDLIPEDLLNKKMVTKDIIDYIKMLTFLYNYNEETVDKLIKNSINSKKQIDKEKIKSNFKKYYQFENNGKMPSILYKNQPEFLKSKDETVSKKAKIIHQFESISPIDFLTAKNNGIKPSRSDINILEYLLVELKLNPGVVNVLIDYCLRINDNKLTKSYIDTIASQWVRSKVLTVTDAMDIANREYNKRKKPVKAKKINKEIKPDWFDKDIKEEVASSKELEEMDAILSQYE
ncbi:MAG: DnaD domain protein [Bacilli bacterium]|nr:DnaD domain protein [Bacilli bacterium]